MPFRRSGHSRTVQSTRTHDGWRGDAHGRTSLVTQRSIRIAVACLLGAALVLAAAASPAAAKRKTPCWKALINDWYDGRIDGTYPIPCYRSALKHLPTDVQTYSSARDDIRQALQARILQSRKGSKAATGATGEPGKDGGSAAAGAKPGGGPNGSGGNAHGKGADTVAGGGAGEPGSEGRDVGGGPVGDAIRNIGPDKADSVPIPLIVLGAIALLLMAAGAGGFLTRRMRLRKLQLASAAKMPQPPPEAPPAGK